MSRIAIVEKYKCHPINCGNFLCKRICPVNRKGEECIFEADSGKAGIDEHLCIGCGICPVKCPYDAISIINLPEELDQDPIHRFGENQFALFSLPIPVFGKVVGILGSNGIGKSTAIKILAGILKPNFGKDKEASYDEVIDFFKGSEAHKFFEKVKAGEITVSYKPQSVDMIPKQFQGSVRELLHKVDEKKEFDKIVEVLELEKFLDNDIAKVSGGELQRVAIAATVLKKANVYFFDEPTSYLDIKQRIKISKFLRTLADENTAVMVIEHDLIILDYMTDLIHIMYGKPACYGVVGLPKSTRTAINVYLSGYSKDENIRFREKAIKFIERAQEESKIKHKLTTWDEIKAKLGKFELKSEKGTLNKNEVVGILGENGIGKTSFVKILAGVIEADSGKISDEIKVAYKPQYIDTDSEELVMNVIKDAIAKYEVQLIKPLALEGLFQKQINQLSGGELQRVAIALCLSRDADLFLLDEPSAYLDVEQRLIVSKIVKDIMDQKGKTALVVDHDLLFIDYLSNKLAVFEGEPAVRGMIKGPFEMQEGMNVFLRDLLITFRRDPESLRPRINKIDSQKDREQKASGKLYYC
jgi:ATP-binding cassette, sub-family E, member 1